MVYGLRQGALGSELLHWELAHTQQQQQLLSHKMGLLWGALCPPSTVSAVGGQGSSATTASFPQLQGEWLQRQVRLLLTSARKSCGIYFNWLVGFFFGGFVCVCVFGFHFYFYLFAFVVSFFFKTMVAWRNVLLCITSLRYSYSARSRDGASDCFWNIQMQNVSFWRTEGLRCLLFSCPSSSPKTSHKWHKPSLVTVSVFTGPQALKGCFCHPGSDQLLLTQTTVHGGRHVKA